MSDSESFISEVTEEVQRDKLYGYVRRYGWMAALLIVALVGGAAWNEYRKASATALAEETGDALLDALTLDDVAERAVALGAIETDGQAVAVAALTAAASQQDAGDIEAAAATLGTLVTNADVPEVYVDLAAFKLAMLGTGDDATRRISLENLARPGETFSLLAQEQLAHLDLASGDPDAAIARLRAIAEDAGVTRGLLERVQTLIVALGAEVDPSAEE